MPYYNWVGIDLLGTTCKGNYFARSVNDLAHVLYAKEIGLLHAYQVKVTVPSPVKIALVIDLAVLLRAHLRLHIAIATISATATHPYVKAVMQDVEQALKEGKSLLQALSYHDIFDELFKALVAAGERSGTMLEACEYAAQYMETMEHYRQKVQASLVTPLITLAFFALVLAFTFIFVIPRFEYFFSYIQEPLPNVTLGIIYISHIVRSWVFLGGLLCMYLGFKVLGSIEKIKLFKQKLSIALPGISLLVMVAYRARFLHTFALLLKGGVPICDALRLCKSTFKSSLLQKEIEALALQVEGGTSLSRALRKTAFSSPQIVALCELGESCSEVSSMVYQAAQLEEQKLYRYIQKLSSLVQPAILILLGILIAGLIFALYMPLLTLSSSIK